MIKSLQKMNNHYIPPLLGTHDPMHLNHNNYKTNPTKKKNGEPPKNPSPYYSIQTCCILQSEQFANTLTITLHE